MKHPQPNKKYLMHCIRGHILKQKKTYQFKRAARSLVHYRLLLATYFEAKKEFHKNENKN